MHVREGMLCFVGTNVREVCVCCVGTRVRGGMHAHVFVYACGSQRSALGVICFDC